LVFNLGDPIISFGFFAAASSALTSYREVGRFYTKSRWFICLAVIFTGINTLVELSNVVHGLPVRKEFTLPQLAHFFLVPLYAAMVVAFCHICSRT
jgi:hypothetical protein